MFTLFRWPRGLGLIPTTFFVFFTSFKSQCTYETRSMLELNRTSNLNIKNVASHLFRNLQSNRTYCNLNIENVASYLFRNLTSWASAQHCSTYVSTIFWSKSLPGNAMPPSLSIIDKIILNFAFLIKIAFAIEIVTDHDPFQNG